MEENKILEYDQGIKNKLKRFIRDFNNKIVDQSNEVFMNYDSSYLEIDRIVDHSELFPIIHPKKGS